jgi:protein-S-isoprenylcysteine O-methyltransferase Ste14
MQRSYADLLLFGVTAAELIVLVRLTPEFTTVDWIYVLQHLGVLGIALTRPRPIARDSSLASSVAVLVSYAYPYAEVIDLNGAPGNTTWPGAGLVMVTLAACLSLASLLTLGRSFGVRPALRSLATHGPYRVVRHPIYLSYMVSDVGYNLQEWNAITVLLTLAGWAASFYRIHAEERILSRSPQWPAYAASVRYRLLPGLW